jgi:hypothetical protein
MYAFHGSVESLFWGWGTGAWLALCSLAMSDMTSQVQPHGDLGVKGAWGEFVCVIVCVCAVEFLFVCVCQFECTHLGCQKRRLGPLALDSSGCECACTCPWCWAA